MKKNPGITPSATLSKNGLNTFLCVKTYELKDVVVNRKSEQ